MTTNQPQNPSENESLSHGLADEPPSHFDDLLSGGSGFEPPNDGNISNFDDSHSLTESEIITKEEFHALFCGGFDATSEFTGFQSMKVQDGDKRAKAASGSIYDTIYEIPKLRRLLNPKNRWYGRAFNIGIFFFMMSRAVAAEMAMKEAAESKTQQKDKSAEKDDTGATDIPNYNLSGKATIQ